MHKPFILLSLLSTLLLASSMTDYQFWHTETMVKSLANDRTISLDVDSRFREHGSQQYYFHSDLRYRFPLSSGLTAGVSFREIFSLKPEGWVREHRPNVEFIFKRKTGNVTSSLRNRLEYRIFTDQTAFRNRTLLTQQFPLPFSSRFSFYIADEIFYDFSIDDFNTNRIYLGIKPGMIRGMKISLYTMWQSTLRGDAWTTFQVSGLKIGF
ncbi:MAG: DUF2490 domain-containing protein [Fidelibacterota bacterium]